MQSMYSSRESNIFEQKMYVVSFSLQEGGGGESIDDFICFSMSAIHPILAGATTSHSLPAKTNNQREYHF